jgi:hypothetical protein
VSECLPTSADLHRPTRLADKVHKGIALVRETRNRFGVVASAWYLLDRVLNLVIVVAPWKVVVIEPHELPAPDPSISARLSCRLATRADLEAMRADPRF